MQHLGPTPNMQMSSCRRARLPAYASGAYDTRYLSPVASEPMLYNSYLLRPLRSVRSIAISFASHQSLPSEVVPTDVRGEADHKGSTVPGATPLASQLNMQQLTLQPVSTLTQRQL
jgi:hypothetical protein